MKRQRTVQVVVGLVGLLYLSWIYPLFDSLWRPNWLQSHQDAFPMFMSVNFTLGVFLLRAVKQPARHRSLIAFGAWSTLAHAATMTVMSAEAWSQGAHRKDSPQDIVIVGAIGLLLLAVLPATDPAAADTEERRSVARVTSTREYPLVESAGASPAARPPSQTVPSRSHH